MTKIKKTNDFDANFYGCKHVQAVLICNSTISFFISFVCLPAMKLDSSKR